LRYSTNELSSGASLIEQTNSTKIPIDKSKGPFAMVIWHISGTLASFALNKNIDLTFDDQIQKFRIVNG